jgi:hypothetical protein
MGTGKTVVDKEKLTDAEIGQIYRKTGEIIRRINDGTIDLKNSIEAMQKIIIEGHANEHLQVVDGLAEIRMLEHLIDDTGVLPFTPPGWSVEKHISCGLWQCNPGTIGLFRSEKQKKKYQEGSKLRKVIDAIKGKKLLNANVLDYLLDHPELIPESWQNKHIFFWGTIYRYSGSRLCVRHLNWSISKWDWGAYWLGSGFSSNDPAALANGAWNLDS